MLMRNITSFASQVAFVLERDRTTLAGKTALLAGHGLTSRGFTSTERFTEAVERQRPDCVVISMQTTGISLDRMLGELLEMQVGVVVTEVDRCAERDALMSLGTIDALPADTTPDRLGRAITRAFSLSRWRRHEARIDSARRAVASLTPREREILAIATRGLTSREAAIELSLSPRTVEMHRASMLARLGVDRMADALRIAYDAGLVPERRTTSRY